MNIIPVYGKILLRVLKEDEIRKIEVGVYDKLSSPDTYLAEVASYPDEESTSIGTIVICYKYCGVPFTYGNYRYVIVTPENIFAKIVNPIPEESEEPVNA